MTWQSRSLSLARGGEPMKRLDAANLLGGPVQLRIPPGQFAGYVVRITGTNQAGQTLAAANLGLVTGWQAHRVWLSLQFADLQIINNIDMGLVEAASAAGGAFAFSAIIQASRVGDGNIFHVVESDDKTIALDLAGVTGVIVAAGQIELFGILQDGAQMYMPMLFTQTPNVPANSTQFTNMTYDNISDLYLTTPTNLLTVQVEKDGETPVQCLWADLLAFSNLDNRIEAAFTTGARVNMNRSGTISEALTDNVRVTLTAGAGGAAAPHIIAVSNDFTPDKLQVSSNASVAKAQMKFTRKADLGKSRPVTVAKALTQASK